MKKHASPLRPIVVKANKTVRRLIHEKAIQFAEGNVSAWIRHASVMYTPGKGERVPTFRPTKDFY